MEALGAIHFAPPKFRSGDAGVKPKDLYFELGINGENGKKQVEELGIRYIFFFVDFWGLCFLAVFVPIEVLHLVGLGTHCCWIDLLKNVLHQTHSLELT